ncbi:MAG: TetR/AcrR family transcriptional regulator [Proteobacteria bacterium]|nr:TetR/AcrR family transcriptional regulator [Pseudomonadota bacterium]
MSRGYDGVSVEDIARRANVGRSTFYLHYKSKGDLLRESIARPSAILCLIVGGDVTIEMLLPQLAHFHQQRTRGASFFREPIRRIWVKRLAEMMEPRLTKVVRHTHARGLLPSAMAALQLAEAQIALISNWLLERPELNPTAVAEALIAVTHGSLRSLLRLRPEVSVLIPDEKLRVVYQSP